MPIETTPEAELRITGEASIGPRVPYRFPIFRTILAGYRIVGENLISFAAVTIFLATVHFSLMKASPFVSGSDKLSMRDGVLQSVLGFASLACMSVVFGIAGARWYRRILLGERRRRLPWFGPREIRFAVCMLLFDLLLTAATMVTPFYWRSVRAFVLDQPVTVPFEHFGPTVMFLWHVLAATLLFFTFPAIAMEIGRPLEHGMRVARHAIPKLFIFYLIGLAPWFALDTLGIRALLLQVDTDRLFFAAIALNTWITTCTLALAGAAYQEITRARLLDQVAVDFE